MCITDGSSSLPFPLQDDNLVTIYLVSDGAYTDEDGTAYIEEGGENSQLDNTLRDIVASMSIGQKLLIEEGIEDICPEVDREIEQRGGKISFVHLSVLSSFPLTTM